MRRIQGRAALGAMLGLVALTGAVKAAETVELGLRPTPKPMRYKVTSEDETSLRGPDGFKKEMRYQVEEQVERTAVVIPGDRIMVMNRSLDRDVTVNGKPVPGEDTPKRPAFETYEKTGKRVVGSARSRSPGEDLHPEFPSGPVEVGRPWSRTIPGTEGFSLPVAVETVVEAVREVRGARCALLKLVANAKGKDSRSGADVSFHSETRMALSLADLQTMRSTTRSEMMIRYPSPLPSGQQSIRRRGKRVVERE